MAALMEDSDDEGTILAQDIPYGDICGYLFEPQLPASAVVVPYPESDDESSSDPSSAWCSCGQCRPELLVGEKEFVCCHRIGLKNLEQHAVAEILGRPIVYSCRAKSSKSNVITALANKLQRQARITG